MAGITRAKNFLILCGDVNVFKFGIQRNDDLARLTSLKERLSEDDKAVTQPIVVEVSDSNSDSEDKQEGDQEVSLTASNHLTIQPLVGMNGATPYDFLDNVN